MITRPAPVAPAKQRASSHIRRLADEVKRTFPDMTVHQHLTDAARENDAGRYDNAKRHLDAAVASFAPLQLIRHGIHDDEGHRAAKNFMQQAHRGRLLVQDTEGIRGENDGLMERRRDAATSALQAKAMRNAQPQPTGRVDRAVTTPGATVETTPKLAMSKQFAQASYSRHPGEDVQCPNCHKFNMDDAKFCDQCGAKLPASAFADLSWGDILSAIELATFAGKKPGSGKNFAKLSAHLASRGAKDPDALAAYIGRRKYGKKRFGKLSHANPAGGGIELAFNPFQPRGHDGKWVRGQGEQGTLGKIFRPGSVTETVASGAGMPEDNRRNPFQDESLRMQWAMQHPQATSDAAKKAATYKALRASGHSHSAAMNILKGTFRQIGRAFQAGSVTQSVTQYAWEDVLDAIELSAQTGRLASEPHPFGKPGGPGLWNVKGMELPPYIQNIARALLRTGRAKDLSQAIAIAKGATNRWSRGGGHVSPEVRAASAKTNASWDAKRATAHAHSNDWYQWVDLTGTAAGAAKDQRIAAGQAGGGQFGSGGGAAAGKQGGGQQQTRAQRKAALLAAAKKDRAQARLLLIRIRADRAALASASGKVSKGQKGSKTATKAATTKSGAPAAKGAAKTAASPVSNAATGLTPQQIKKATAQATAQAKGMSKQQLLSAIKTLSAQEKNLLKAAAADVAQASKL